MELKGLDKIENIINNFLIPFECEAEAGTDFMYNFLTNKITFSLFEIGSGGDEFLLDAESRFPQIHAPLFIWSLLHELGHRETIDDLETEEIFESEKIKWYDTKEDSLAYFTAPDEYAATEWAGNYMISHEREVAELWDKLVPAIHNFYILNEIKDD